MFFFQPLCFFFWGSLPTPPLPRKAAKEADWRGIPSAPEVREGCRRRGGKGKPGKTPELPSFDVFFFFFFSGGVCFFRKIAVSGKFQIKKWWTCFIFFRAYIFCSRAG